MIVYGDPSTTDLLCRFVDEFRMASGDLRSQMIRAGMLEQAVEDAGPDTLPPSGGVGPRTESYRALTDRLAERFVADRSAGLGPDSDLGLRSGEDDEPVTIKLPEGFAFYGLYPEAYAEAALRWRRDHAEARTCGVVGVRSIGTTLSAVVAAALRGAGVDARRLTVRPTGHPFARELSLDPSLLEGAADALVVDEGPGLSGSSMAAVAEALVRAGVAPDRIAFLPGHGGEPGGQASERVRRRWRETPRYVMPTERLRWNGRTLEETILDATAGGVELRELTGGAWRDLVDFDPAERPVVVSAFERRKLLVRRSDGTAVLWKFVGLTVPGTTLGFAPAEWIEGRPPTRADADPRLLTQLGRHLADAAGTPLSAEACRAGAERLAAMLAVNAREAGVALGWEPPRFDTGRVGAGDYRTAPAEWRLRAGGMVKAGRIAPTLDHTVAGRQPIGWDVAGALVEWGLDEASAGPLLAAAPPVAPHELRFYRAAYAAYRLGVLSMADPGEGAALERARAFYLEALRASAGGA